MKKFSGEWKELADAAKAAGWQIIPTNSGHVKWEPPQRSLTTVGHGGSIFTAGTPSDWRAIKNTRAKLRRAGLDV